jgi:hypothetical protein
MEDNMTTPITRTAVSIVSLVAILGATLALGGCGAGRAVTLDDAFATSDGRLALTFENQAQTYVDVYLITEQWQRQLGRVDPGARRILWIPESALRSTSSFVRLAVLAGAPLTADAVHDPRASFTILQPVSDLFAQRWTYLKTPLASPELSGAPVDSRHR